MYNQYNGDDDWDETRRGNYYEFNMDTAYVQNQKAPVESYFPIVVLIIIVANLIAWFLCSGVEGYTKTGGLNYDYVVKYKEYGRLISSMFLHINLPHLASNMISLWFFGRLVEEKLGCLRTAIIYFASGIGSAVISMNMYHIRYPGEMRFSLGASGAVFGFICAGAFIQFKGEGKAKKKDMYGAIILVVVYAIFTMKENVDIYAHVGGAIIGGVLSFLLNIKKWEGFKENRFVKYLGILMTVWLCIMGVGEANNGKKAAELPDEKVSYIKEQKVYVNNDITYGEAFDNYFADAHWESFIATDGSIVVEFDGVGYYKGVKSDIEVQFILNEQLTDYKLGYFGVNGNSITQREAGAFLEHICGLDAL